MKKSDYVEAYPEEDRKILDPGLPQFHLETVKVVREWQHFNVGAGRQTIGEMVDQAIGDALRNGTELLDLHINFEREDWEKMRVLG